MNGVSTVRRVGLLRVDLQFAAGIERRPGDAEVGGEPGDEEADRQTAEAQQQHRAFGLADQFHRRLNVVGRHGASGMEYQRHRQGAARQAAALAKVGLQPSTKG